MTWPSPEKARPAEFKFRVHLSAAGVHSTLLGIFRAALTLALFYSGEVALGYLAASVAVTGLLMTLNRWGIYWALPYAVLDVVL